MNTSENQWKKSTFVSAAHVVQKPRSTRRPAKRLTGILRADKVKLNPLPVAIGAKPEKIQLAPIMQNNQVKALHVSCTCGCESTFNVQYATEGETA